MSALRLEMRLRNNVLWHAIYDRWPSVAAFCEETGLDQSRTGLLLNLKLSPWKQDGTMREIALLLAIALKIVPEDLYPEGIYELERTEHAIAFETNALADLSQIRALAENSDPAAAIEAVETAEVVETALKSLTHREREIVKMRYGLDPAHGGHEYTPDECGRVWRISRERVRQIEAKAIRKLQHPTRSAPLRRNAL